MGQRGHLHFVAPILAIVAVGGIGAAYLALSSAATSTVSASVYTGNCAQKYALTQAAAASANSTCVKEVQDLIDIYQYSAGGHFAIPGAGETFSYNGQMTMVIMNGAYNGATQSAVNTIDGGASPSLTNASLSGTTVNKGTWDAFCSAVHGKIGTAAFTGHSTYDFSPSKNKAAGYYIGSSGVTIFNTVCGSPQTKSFTVSTGGSSGSGTGTLCTSYTISTSSNPTPSGSPCVYYIQTILNGANASNPFSYNSYASKYNSYYKIGSNGPIGGVNANERNYNQETAVRIMAFQATVAYNGTPLSVTGTTDAMTWDALCALAHTYGSGNSYIQAAITVSKASDSGCSKVTGKITSAPHQTTPPPLSCGGGSTLNSAKTACSCPSGQTYSGGKCVTASSGGGSGTGAASVTVSASPNPYILPESSTVTRTPITISWSSTGSSISSCTMMGTDSGVTGTMGRGGPSGSLKFPVAWNNDQLHTVTVTVTCSNSAGQVVATSKSLTVTVEPHVNG
jgi:hypothetical protein